MRDRFQWVDQVEGRDKLAKCIQGYCKIMRYCIEGAGGKATKWNSAYESLSSFRSVLKFFKFFKSWKEVKEITSQKAITSVDIVEVGGIVFDSGYKFGDNIEFLGNMGFVSIGLFLRHVRERGFFGIIAFLLRCEKGGTDFKDVSILCLLL